MKGPESNDGIANFDRLMRGLVQVPKAELDEAMKQEKRLKLAKPDQPKHRKLG